MIGLDTSAIIDIFKGEESIKEFLIEMHKVNKDLVAHPRKHFGKARETREKPEL